MRTGHRCPLPFFSSPLFREPGYSMRCGFLSHASSLLSLLLLLVLGLLAPLLFLFCPSDTCARNNDNVCVCVRALDFVSLPFLWPHLRCLCSFAALREHRSPRALPTSHKKHDGQKRKRKKTKMQREQQHQLPMSFPLCGTLAPLACTTTSPHTSAQ